MAVLSLSTPRLTLIPATLALARAELRDRQVFARMLNARIPENWPPEILADALPAFLQLLEFNAHPVGWLTWYWVLNDADAEQRVLVGSGGFRGEPDARGTVELGYSVLPQFQGLGFATEAVGALLDWAWRSPQVSAIIAEVVPDNLPSRRVLEKLHFRRLGQGAEPGTDRYYLAPPVVVTLPHEEQL